MANHLNKLMNDDKLYLSYFAWRQKYVVDCTAPVDGISQLCRLLIDENMKKNSILTLLHGGLALFRPVVHQPRLLSDWNTTNEL